MTEKMITTAIIDLQCELVAERNRVNPQQISWLQYDILAKLAQTDAVLPSALCLTLGISRVKLAKSFKKLKQLNYIEQHRADADGRAQLTKISATGLALLQNIQVGHDNLAQLVSQTLTDAEQRLFSQLANRISAALKSRRIHDDQ